MVGFGIAARMNTNLTFFLPAAVLQDSRRVLVGEESLYESLHVSSEYSK